MNLISSWEKVLLEKTFEGPFQFFERIKKQLKDLQIVERIFEDGRYLARYEYVGGKENIVHGVEANLIIDDGCITIEESSEVFLIEVTILYGHVCYLQISGRYDFSQPFTIKEIFWSRNLEKWYWKPGERQKFGIHYEYVKNSNEREFGFGYIPGYK